MVRSARGIESNRPLLKRVLKGITSLTPHRIALNVLYKRNPNPEKISPRPVQGDRSAHLVPFRSDSSTKKLENAVSGLASTVLKGITSLTPHDVAIDLSYA